MQGYLELEAALGTASLHPGGAAATSYLLSRLPLVAGCRALDIGCGIGATAHRATHLGATVVALDILPRMLSRAARRDGPPDGREALLVWSDLVAGLPFSDGSFDLVWAESVLALIDARRALAEAARVLRRGGTLALNERIWVPGVSADEASRINSLSRACFGIPAATAEPLDRAGWVALLEQAGLAVLEVRRVDAGIAPPTRLPLKERLTRQLRYLSPPTVLARSLRWRWLARRHRAAWSRLESWILVARKPA